MIGPARAAFGSLAAAGLNSACAAWIPDNLNDGHLDYVFFSLAGMMAANLALFATIARGFEPPHCHVGDEGDGAPRELSRALSDSAGPGMNSELMCLYTCDLDFWFYRDLAGIGYDPEQPGFKHIIFRPQPVGDLAFVEASCKTVRGTIASHWKIENGAFHWDITIPANTTATVYLPAEDADSTTESGNPLHEAEGVNVTGICGNRLVLKVESGRYSFVAKYNGS